MFRSSTVEEEAMAVCGWGGKGRPRDGEVEERDGVGWESSADFIQWHFAGKYLT